MLLQCESTSAGAVGVLSGLVKHVKTENGVRQKFRCRHLHRFLPLLPAFAVAAENGACTRVACACMPTGKSMRNVLPSADSSSARDKPEEMSLEQAVRTR